TEPSHIVERLRLGIEGVLVGRGVLRNPWILAQAEDMMAGRPAREVSSADRGRFLLDYIELLEHERVDEARALSHDRWVINKVRALAAYFTKGVEGGAQLRGAINTCDSLPRLKTLLCQAFIEAEPAAAALVGGPTVSF